MSGFFRTERAVAWKIATTAAAASAVAVSAAPRSLSLGRESENPKNSLPTVPPFSVFSLFLCFITKVSSNSRLKFSSSCSHCTEPITLKINYY